jgi:hypothetical protein
MLLNRLSHQKYNGIPAEISMTSYIDTNGKFEPKVLPCFARTHFAYSKLYMYAF